MSSRLKRSEASAVESLPLSAVEGDLLVAGCERTLEVHATRQHMKAPARKCRESGHKIIIIIIIMKRVPFRDGTVPPQNHPPPRKSGASTPHTRPHPPTTSPPPLSP